jgi:hypothetical protein
MKQNDDIRLLLDEGKNKVTKAEEKVLDEEKVKKQTRIEMFDSLMSQAKKIVPAFIADALKYNQDNLISNINFSDQIMTLNDFLETDIYFDIDGLSPVYVKFASDCSIVEYIAPAICWFDEEECYLWTTGGNISYWRHDSQCIRSLDLSLVMYHAQRNQEIYQRESEKLKPEPKYINFEPGKIELPDSADQRVLTGIRAIIREEIHAMACAD